MYVCVPYFVQINISELVTLYFKLILPSTTNRSYSFFKIFRYNQELAAANLTLTVLSIALSSNEARTYLRIYSLIFST